MSISRAFILSAVELFALLSTANALNCNPNLRDPPEYFPTQALTGQQKAFPFDCTKNWASEPFQTSGTVPTIGFQGDQTLANIPAGVFQHQGDGGAMHGIGFAFCPKLKSWASDAFSGLTKLARLHLTYGAITRIPAHAFTDLSALQILDFQGNPLSVWEKGWSEGLRKGILLLVSKPWDPKTQGPTVRAGYVHAKSWCEKKNSAWVCHCEKGMIGGDEGFCDWPNRDREL